MKSRRLRRAGYPERSDDDRSARKTMTPFHGGLVLNGVDDEKRWKIIHTHYTLVAVRHGEAEWRYRNRYVNVAPGTLFVCEPGEVHETVRTRCPGDFTAVFVDPEEVARAAEGLGGGRWPHFPALGVCGPELWRQCALLSDDAALADPLIVAERASLLVTELLRRAGAAREAAHTAVDGLARARELIQELVVAESQSVVSIRGLADVAGLEYHSFIHAFKSRYGIAPYEMVCGLRAQHALRVLRDGPRPGCSNLAALAARCGYADAAHMARSFKRYWGVPPGTIARGLSAGWLRQGEGRSRRRAVQAGSR